MTTQIEEKAYRCEDTTCNGLINEFSQRCIECGLPVGALGLFVPPPQQSQSDVAAVEEHESYVIEGETFGVGPPALELDPLVEVLKGVHTTLKDIHATLVVMTERSLR